VLPAAATCREAVRTRPRQQEARTGAASRRHMPRSRSDSPATTGGPHRQCQSLPHAVESFGLARDNGRRAPALPVAATCRGAVRTRPRQQEARTGVASRRHMPRIRSDLPATMGGAHRQCQSPPNFVEDEATEEEVEWLPAQDGNNRSGHGGVPGVELRWQPGRQGVGEGPAAAADGAARSSLRERIRSCCSGRNPGFSSPDPASPRKSGHGEGGSTRRSSRNGNRRSHAAIAVGAFVGSSRLVETLPPPSSWQHGLPVSR